MKIKNLGFTLVELLIVIALIAILSVAVLATINPIEQSAKARDAAFKNDAAEILSAYERYFAGGASQNAGAYPWTKGTEDVTQVLKSTDYTFGIVDVGDSKSVLISTSELKASFQGKKPFLTDVSADDTMYTYHNANINDNYVCFVPKSKANRALPLKCITGTGDNKALLNAGDTDCAAVTDWGASGVTTVNNTTQNKNAILMCVPEGNIAP